jgi:hypothetical protein
MENERQSQMEMSEETKKRLRGRPANAPRNHEYGSPIEREQWIDRLSGQKHSGGLSALKTYYSGILLKPRKAMLAMCCECLGFFADGLNDCECPRCPLYPYMPYRSKNIK